MRLPYRQAKRSEAKPLIGLYGKSHSGKTKTALMLARGYVGPTGKIVMIETEGGRGEVYADEIPGGYGVLPIRESYSPQDYGDAIDEANKLGAQALIIDSGSHEWEGPGGVLAMAEASPGHGMQKWLKPKVDHAKHFLLKLQTTPIPLVVLCMRAKNPMEEQVGRSGKKEWVRSAELVPIQSEDILSEMLISGWIDNEAHAFHVYASRTPQLAAVFAEGKPITYATGEALAAYSRGESVQSKRLSDEDKATISRHFASSKTTKELEVAWRALPKGLHADDIAEVTGLYKKRAAEILRSQPQDSAP